MVTAERLYTAEDLWELSYSPEYVGIRLELSDGRLIVTFPIGWKHGGIALRLDRVIGDHVEQHDLGMTTAAETGSYVLPEIGDRNCLHAYNLSPYREWWRNRLR